MNLVVITAALSSANTNLYLTSRTLFSLSHDGYVPKALGDLGSNGVPYIAPAWYRPPAWLRPSCWPSSLPAGRSCCFTASQWPECSSSGPSSCSPILPFAARSEDARCAQLPIRLPFSPYSQIAALHRTHRHRAQHLLRGGPAILGSEFHAVPAVDHSLLLDHEAEKRQ